MRWFLLCLGFAGVLDAQGTFRIVAVERQGLPPYESTDRVYGLDGGQERGLRVGDRLMVKRTGEALPLGHLQVTAVHPDRSAARFESAEGRYPMKGDVAALEVYWPLPKVPQLEAEPLPATASPQVAPEPPPREGCLFFLPMRADLSPAGVKKLEAWVEAWGAGGRWVVHVPSAKALKPAVQKERIESLQSALRNLGIEKVTVETEPRTSESRYEPAWVRRRD